MIRPLNAMLKISLTAVIGMVLFASVVNAAIIASTDFNGRTVSGTTASNLTWTLNGVSSPGDLTVVDTPVPVAPALALFNTAAAQNRFAVNRNLHNEGSWSVDVGLDVLTGNNIDLGLVALDAFIFNNSGALQTVQRHLSLNLSLLDSSFTLIDQDNALDIFANSGAITQPQPISFDLLGNTLAAGGMYYLRLTAFGSGPGNNAGIDNFVVNGDLVAAPVPEPGTLILLGAGIACLVGTRIRRKK